MKTYLQALGTSLSRNMCWRRVRAVGRSLCWRNWEHGCLKTWFRGCYTSMPEMLPVVRFIFWWTRPGLNWNTAEEARAMLQGVGSRFDFHINKTLCDLRLDPHSKFYTSFSWTAQNAGDLRYHYRLPGLDGCSPGPQGESDFPGLGITNSCLT